MELGLENTFATELEGLFVPWKTDGFPEAELLLVNTDLVAELGFDEAMIRKQGAAWFSGTQLPEDAVPLAQAYAGHQFGGFSPQLGDGRALLLGERVDPDGRRVDLQLKGSGATPFSRGGDGLAPLAPVLREYLMGEAMFHLGIPTSRALVAVTTGEPVRRQRGMEPGAVLTRVASSHLRVGSLQFFAARRDLEKLARLVDYALARHYPDRVGEPNPALQLLEAVATVQAKLISKWMQVGFVHGVMNTDNVTLSGETIDYGPCAFLDAYTPDSRFSSIDEMGRYAYGQQPRIGQWNLARMAEALLPMLAGDEDAAVAHAQKVLETYSDVYATDFLCGMRSKLGLTGEEGGDRELVSELLQWMHDNEQDYTSTFRTLARDLRAGGSRVGLLVPGDWKQRWLARMGGVDAGETAARMDTYNPIYVPRNHLVETALQQAVAGDMGPYEALLQVLKEPYTEREGFEEYALPAPAEFGFYQTFCGT